MTKTTSIHITAYTAKAGDVIKFRPLGHRRQVTVTVKRQPEVVGKSLLVFGRRAQFSKTIGAICTRGNENPYFVPSVDQDVELILVKED